MMKHNHKHDKHGKAETQAAQQNSGDAAEAQAEVRPDDLGTPGPAPEGAAGAGTAAGASPVNPDQKNAELEAKLAELNDQYLRKAADFENFRKRMNREKQELTEFANQNLLLDLLPALDDFERAIKSAGTADLQSSKDFAVFYEGIVMIEKQLSSQLENKWGLKRFDSEGQLFDPNRHEAIQMEKTTGLTEAVVKEDYVKGYFLRERVIRYAKVKVLVPADGEGGAPGGETLSASLAAQQPPSIGQES